MKKKKKALGKKKKKMTDKRKTYLKREIKKKFGNELSAFLHELSNYEMEKLLSGDINPNTLKKYSWFFTKQNFDKNALVKKQRWLTRQYAPYKSVTKNTFTKFLKEGNLTTMHLRPY